MKKMEESYNHAQRQWVDNMINACQVEEMSHVQSLWMGLNIV